MPISFPSLKLRAAAYNAEWSVTWAGDTDAVSRLFRGPVARGDPAPTGGTAKPQNPKPQRFLALDDSDEEVVYLRNSCSDSHGFMALKWSTSSTLASAIMLDSPPPGSDTIFRFGQHKGLTYERVLCTYLGYVLWGQKDVWSELPLPGPVQKRLQGVH